MAGKIDARLLELGIEIPEMATPAAKYVPYVISGNLVFVSGQVPFVNGKLEHNGKVGKEYTTAEGAEIAAICTKNILAAVKHACGGDLDRVTRVVKLGGFVNCIDGFGEQPQVINGASNMIGDIFGDVGQHARFAVGTNALPMNVPVEIDAVFEID